MRDLLKVVGVPLVMLVLVSTSAFIGEGVKIELTVWHFYVGKIACCSDGGIVRSRE